MLNKARIARSVLAILFITGLFVSACRAETMTTYSGRYILDMEQKRTLLDSIREDAEKTQAGLKENADRIKDVETKKTSHLSLDSINLSELMPPAGNINVAFTATNYMLSPEPGTRALKDGDNRTRQ